MGEPLYIADIWLANSDARLACNERPLAMPSVDWRIAR